MRMSNRFSILGSDWRARGGDWHASRSRSNPDAHVDPQHAAKQTGVLLVIFDSAKRGFDIVGALALVPLVLLCALIVKIIQLRSPGPLLFVQERIGKGGATFRMIKFRTMEQNAEPGFATNL